MNIKNIKEKAMKLLEDESFLFSTAISTVAIAGLIEQLQISKLIKFTKISSYLHTVHQMNTDELMFAVNAIIDKLGETDPNWMHEFDKVLAERHGTNSAKLLEVAKQFKLKV